MSMVRLAESLVHETIHSVLFVLEIDQPLSQDHARMYATNGLYYFWDAALTGGVFDSELAGRRRDVARSGFGKASLIDQVKAWRNGIPAALWDQIQVIGRSFSAHRDRTFRPPRNKLS